MMRLFFLLAMLMACLGLSASPSLAYHAEIAVSPSSVSPAPAAPSGRLKKEKRPKVRQKKQGFSNSTIYAISLVFASIGLLLFRLAMLGQAPWFWFAGIGIWLVHLLVFALMTGGKRQVKPLFHLVHALLLVLMLIIFISLFLAATPFQPLFWISMAMVLVLGLGLGLYAYFNFQSSED